MKCGLIMTACAIHSMQVESWTAARRFSRPDTPVIVLFNGREPDPMPDGIEAVVRPDSFKDEADLWQWGLELARARGWDWCMFVHDDFAMRESGWESELALAEGWRVALASWCVHAGWDPSGGTGMATERLGCTLDSMSFGFRVDVFRERGCVTDKRYGFGFGAWDACGWALDNGYGIWRILLNSDHQWRHDNSRTVMGGVGAPGHQEVTAAWRHLLPALATETDLVLGDGRRIRCAPADWQPGQPRRTVCALNDENVVITDGSTREHWRQGKRI